MIPKHVIRFSIKCHPKHPQKIGVVIYNSLYDLNLMFRLEGNSGYAVSYLKWFKGHKSRWRSGKKIGELVFCRKSLKISSITHESIHAGILWMTSINRKINWKNEELFAEAVSNIATKISIRAIKIEKL